MNWEYIENVATTIAGSYGVLTKRGKSYMVGDAGAGDKLMLVPLASPEVLHIIQLSFKNEIGETADNASVMEVLDLLYQTSHNHRID